MEPTLEQLYRDLISLQNEYKEEQRKHNEALMRIRITANSLIKTVTKESNELIERTDLTDAINKIEKQLTANYLNSVRKN